MPRTILVNVSRADFMSAIETAIDNSRLGAEAQEAVRKVGRQSMRASVGEFGGDGTGRPGCPAMQAGLDVNENGRLGFAVAFDKAMDEFVSAEHWSGDFIAVIS